MDTRRRLSIVLAAITIASAWAGASHATAGPDWAAATEALAAEHQAAKTTPTPTRAAAGSSIGDDLIYDMVGPPPIDPGAKGR